MAYKVSNFARMSLVQSASAAATTLFVSAEDGDLLPALGVSDTAPAVLFNSSAAEIVYITAEADGALTVTRAQEGTAARDWPSGTIIIHTPTAALFQLILNAAFAVASFIGTATNVGDAYTVDVGANNPIPQLQEGERLFFLLPATNTTVNPTLVVTNGVSSTLSAPIINNANLQMKIGDLNEDWLVEFRYSQTFSAWVLVSDGSFQEYGISLNEGPLPAVNRHRNGRLDAWNGGTSFATPASGTETADGWEVQYDGTIGAFTVNRQDFALGQTEVPDNPKHYLRWTQSGAGSGSTLRRLRIKLPGVHWRAGKTARRSFYAKADAARQVTGKVIQHFGTGGAPSADVEASSIVFNLTTDWQAFTTPVNLPSVVGKTLGSNEDDGLYLTFDLPLNVTMTVEIAVDDFRPGTTIANNGTVPPLQSDTFPLPTFLGGTGGSFENLDDLGASIGGVVHTTGNETIEGVKSFRQAVDSSTITYENTTTTHEMETRFASLGTLWELTPSPSGTPDATKGFGYDFANARWFHDVELRGNSGARIALDAGSAGSPALYFPGMASNHGMYFTGAEWAFSYSGVAHVFWNSTRMRIVPAVEFSAGSAGSPSIYHLNDNNSGRYHIGADNIGETTNGVLRFDWNTTRLQFGVGFDVVLPATAIAPTSVMSVGFRGAPVVSGNSAYAFPATDAGHTVYHDEAGVRTWTIPANASVPHPIGTMFILDNTGNAGAAGAITLAITSDTLRRGDGTAGTGSRTIPASAVAVIRKKTATEWVITGIFT